MANSGSMGSASNMSRVSNFIPQISDSSESTHVSRFRKLGCCCDVPEYWKVSAGNGGGVGWGQETVQGFLSSPLCQ